MTTYPFDKKAGIIYLLFLFAKTTALGTIISQAKFFNVKAAQFEWANGVFTYTVSKHGNRHYIQLGGG